MGILAEADRRTLERIGYENGRRGERVVRCLENCRRRGGGERSPEMPAGSVDLEAALWMARGCQAVGRYDDHVLAAAWLERAKPGEESGDPAARETAGSAASGGFQGSADPAEEGRAARGEWHWRMALASMYCGDPEEALEEAKNGVEFAPDSPMAWRIFAELSAGLGDRQAGLEAVRRGRASLEGASSGEEDAAFGHPPDDWGELEEMILSGAGLEDLERARLLHMGQKNGESGSRLERLRLEAARGITEDEAGLLRVKEVLRPEIWDTDTAYCGFCCNFEGRELEGAFYMNEAAVSKWTPEEMREILKMLPKIHRQARVLAAAEEDDWGLLELYGDHSWGLAFETDEGERRVLVSAGGELALEPASVSAEREIPLPRGNWSFQAFMEQLERDWGISPEKAGARIRPGRRFTFEEGGLSRTVEVLRSGFLRRQPTAVKITVKAREGEWLEAELELERLAETCARLAE